MLDAARARGLIAPNDAMRFDVFGRQLVVERLGDRWVAFYQGPEGKRRPADGIVIPPDLLESEIGQYLDDLCHEWATRKHPTVRRLEPQAAPKPLSLSNRPFFCSWSGGKDSCLALHHAVRQGGKPRRLLTMLTEDGEHSRSHGLPRALLEAQARSLGVPIVFRAASWEDYEAVFVDALRELRADGIEAGVFGDIDLDPHREWVERVCGLADILPVHPLWQRERRGLLAEFIALGFQATIVVLNEDKLARRFLGKAIDAETVAELEEAGVDAAGEQGEYHTVVTAGPLFSTAIPLEIRGRIQREGYWFLEVETCSRTETQRRRGKTESV